MEINTIIEGDLISTCTRVVGKIRADSLYAVVTVRFNAVQPQSVSVLTDLLHFGFDLVQSYYHSLSQTQNTKEKSQSRKYSMHVNKCEISIYK